MKKIFVSILLVSICMILFSCATSKTKKNNTKYVELAKNFYTEYLNEFENNSDDFIGNLSKIKKKYMTDIMIEEMELRNKQMDADSIIEAQDGYGLLSIMEVRNGKSDGWVQIIFDNKQNNEKRIFNVHFRDIDGKNLIDSIDSTIIRKDAYGKLEERTTKTKYANKDKLTDDDKKEMEDIRNYYNNLEEQGFIG